MKIENYGVSERCREVMRRFLVLEGEGKLPESIGRIIILPIPSARDRIHITGTDKLISEVLSDAESSDFIIGYGIPEEDVALARAVGAHLYDLSKDEAFLLENAKISAVGALGHILTTQRRVPAELKVGIVGYGRIGKELARMLLFLGANVCIYTSKKVTRVVLGEYGIKTVYMERGAQSVPCIEGLDVLVNTAPTNLSATFKEGKIPQGLYVLELASGKNFEGVEGVVTLSSIPDKMYPKTAGEAYLGAVLAHIGEVYK